VIINDKSRNPFATHGEGKLHRVKTNRVLRSICTPFEHWSVWPSNETTC